MLFSNPQEEQSLKLNIWLKLIFSEHNAAFMNEIEKRAELKQLY